MKKTYALLGILLLILSGCSTSTTEIWNTTKEPFYITTQTFEKMWQKAVLTKHGKILWTNDIVVTAQAMGRVKTLAHQMGEEVEKGTLIIALEDSAGTYTFSAQRAKAALDQAQISYQQTTLSLDKAITDTELALQQAERQANEAGLDKSGSTASLQVENLEQQASKAAYDYQTKLDADAVTIENFIITTENIVKDVQLLYQDIKVWTDTIMGTSDLYKAENDSFEHILGARNTATRSIAETQVRLLRQKENQINSLNTNITQENLHDTLHELRTVLKDFQAPLDAVDTMLTYTLPWSALSEVQLNTFIGTINGLQAQLQAQISRITQQLNGIDTFLVTYKQQQESLHQSVELAKQQTRIAKENLETANFGSDIHLETITHTYQTTQKNKQTTQAALLNGIAQARIAYNQANNELAKLTIEAPIQGIIGDILVDIGQEVSPGTPLFTISSQDEQQVEVALGASEIDLVEIGQEVLVHNGKALSGTLASVSKTADRNFTYKAMIQLQETGDILGELVDVTIPVQHRHPLIPITNITILNTNSGLLNIREDNKIKAMQVNLGKIRWSNIEILSEIDDTTQVITSDTSNFNEAKYEIQVRTINT